MIEVYLALGFYDAIRARRDSFPAPVTGLVVSAVQGHHVQVTAPPSGDFAFGAVEVTNANSAAYGLSAIVTAVAGGVIELDRPFLGRALQPGDVLTLSGGPLSKCTPYYGEPGSIAEAVAAGKQFFVTIVPMNVAMVNDSAAGRGLKGRDGVRSLFGFEAICETPWVYGDSEVSALKAYTDLPLFVHQVVYYLYQWRMRELEGAYVTGEVAWDYHTWERPGMDGPMQAAVIEYDVAVK